MIRYLEAVRYYCCKVTRVYLVDKSATVIGVITYLIEYIIEEYTRRYLIVGIAQLGIYGSVCRHIERLGSCRGAVSVGGQAIFGYRAIAYIIYSSTNR